METHSTNKRIARDLLTAALNRLPEKRVRTIVSELEKFITDSLKLHKQARFYVTAINRHFNNDQVLEVIKIIMAQVEAEAQENPRIGLKAAAYYAKARHKFNLDQKRKTT